MAIVQDTNSAVKWEPGSLRLSRPGCDAGINPSQEPWGVKGVRKEKQSTGKISAHKYIADSAKWVQDRQKV